ncbi:PAS domain-containing sensor histidine kinase [Chlorobium phaeobacteroides]|uniref:Oxygen sensor histidine kinase NreB n=1 Tax=Chlorobium phaeobacteroides (strain DSM 266 / SMG 266 / 2430) TaxID=290317 RepID=A1BJU4_CHLPD|nr:PAS domain S-box protein [Chlorobium phaeobacteroides]ABL66671.1 PAS/PAC sensor signal transduction histidine kinase [Chlorobium phaeobacteroides DSM 266]
MKKNRTADADDFSEKRLQAEAILLHERKKKVDSLESVEDRLRIIHELSVNQIELEMQQDELLQSRAVLEAGLKRYNELYDFAPLGYLTIAADSTIRKLNLTAATMLGLDRSLLKGDRLGRFIVYEDLPVFNALIKRVFATRESGYCEVMLLDHARDKQEIATSGPRQRRMVRIDAIVNSEKQECWAFLTDITIQKQLEDSLWESDRLYRCLIETVSEGVLVIHGDHLRFVNPIVSEMTGYTEAELLSFSFTDMMHPDDRERVKHHHLKCLKSDLPDLRIELRIIKKNGRILWIEMGGLKTEWNGKPAMLYVLIDITERKVLEEKLQTEKQQLLDTLRTTDQYQAQLQELNSKIKVMSEVEERSLLYRDLHDGAGQSLHAVCLHLKMIADGRGGYGDLKSLASELAGEIADISAEIRDIAHHLRPAYLQEITLDRAIIKRCEMLGRRGVPISISCVGDFSSLSCQVSENLYRISQEAIANADRHAAATLITVRLTRVDNALTLLIADNGCGIKDVSTNKGVGLRIIEERVSLIGGKLDMASTASGTTITVTLELP